MNTFVARQPIFDRRQRIFGYELLFREGTKNQYDYIDGDKATNSVLENSFLLMGLHSVTGGKRAFINFTSNLLRKNVAASFSKDLIAVEILETVEPDEEIITVCKNLKQMGYVLVLDDFIFYPHYQPLIELADIIKVDFLNTSLDERKTIFRQADSTKTKFLAEKIETHKQFEEALAFGYNYFQGYYFSEPIILIGKEIPGSSLNYLKLLQEINQPEISFENLERIMKQEVSLSFKLLKFLNSSYFGFHSKISSIRQALMLLGTREIRKWASLLTLKNIGDNKPDQLVLISVFRAKFGESVAKVMGLKEQASNAFLMGLFSMIDVFLSRELKDILEELPICEDVKKALLGEDNLWRRIYELTVRYEKGDWQSFSQYSSILQVDESLIPPLYLEALDLAEEIFAAE
jgi:EAL and modified HD-GYP domain-containing signal transduction protein